MLTKAQDSSFSQADEYIFTDTLKALLDQIDRKSQQLKLLQQSKLK